MQKKTYAVLGLGRYGAAVAKELVKNGTDVIAVDNNEQIVQDVSSYLPICKCADVTDPEVISELGISNADVVIVAMASNLEESILAITLCKEKGVKTTFFVGGYWVAQNEDLLKIVDIMLAKVRKELGTNHRDFEVSQDVKRALVASCREPQYGARPLRRAIQQMIEDPLADKVIDGEFPEGSRMLIDVSEEDRAELAAREAEGMIGSSSSSKNGDDDNFQLVFKLAE